MLYEYKKREKIALSLHNMMYANWLQRLAGGTGRGNPTMSVFFALKGQLPRRAGSTMRYPRNSLKLN